MSHRIAAAAVRLFDYVSKKKSSKRKPDSRGNWPDAFSAALFCEEKNVKTRQSLTIDALLRAIERGLCEGLHVSSNFRVSHSLIEALLINFFSLFKHSDRL
jgi:hypothetical protein